MCVYVCVCVCVCCKVVCMSFLEELAPILCQKLDVTTRCKKLLRGGRMPLFGSEVEGMLCLSSPPVTIVTGGLLDAAHCCCIPLFISSFKPLPMPHPRILPYFGESRTLGASPARACPGRPLSIGSLDSNAESFTAAGNAEGLQDCLQQNPSFEV
jgi:hypothetical protein